MRLFFSFSKWKISLLESDFTSITSPFLFTKITFTLFSLFGLKFYLIDSLLSLFFGIGLNYFIETFFKIYLKSIYEFDPSLITIIGAFICYIEELRFLSDFTVFLLSKPCIRSSKGKIYHYYVFGELSWAFGSL